MPSDLYFKNGANPTRVATAIAGTYVVQAADVTATFAGINLLPDLAAYDSSIVTIYRANVSLAGGTVTNVAGVLRIATGGGYTLTAGDVITYIVFGSLTN